MKFIAKLRVWGNWGIGENVLKVFLRFRGSANRRVDLFLPLIASISGRTQFPAGGIARGASRWSTAAKGRLWGQPRFAGARKSVAPFRLRDLEGRLNSPFPGLF